MIPKTAAAMRIGAAASFLEGAHAEGGQGRQDQGCDERLVSPASRNLNLAAVR